MEEPGSRIYHEKQRLQFCLLHALNNLFQEAAFSRAELNGIAGRLVLDLPEKEAWAPLSALFSPHHNAITGNYDINVLIAAIEGKGKTIVWHDRRNGSSSIPVHLPESRIMGILLNVPVKRIGGLWRSRHWVALRRLDDAWYNLDSDLSTPHKFNDCEGVRDFLEGIVAAGHQGARDRRCLDRMRWSKFGFPEQGFLSSFTFSFLSEPNLLI